MKPDSPLLHNNMATQSGAVTPKLRIDEILPYIDEFGKYQIFFNAILCLLKIPTGNALMMPYFTHKNPPWRCITGSNSSCNLNGTFSPSSKDYQHRCSIPRSDWQYTQAKDYSIVTQVCGNRAFLFRLLAPAQSAGHAEAGPGITACLFVFLAFERLLCGGAANRKEWKGNGSNLQTNY